MADIMLHTTGGTGFTCVSNSFIDDFMKDANGEYVKVYLYLLRCLTRDGFEFSISQLADCLDHTEKDVMRAFTYWEKVGILRLEYSSDNELSGIYLVDVNGNGYGKTESPVISNITSMNKVTHCTSTANNNIAPVYTTVDTKPSYSPDQLKAFSEDQQVEDLIFAIQTYLKRPLSISDTTTLLFWYDSLHFSVDLIQYLVETCIGGGHNSFHYMDTVARNWAEDGITTVDEAISTSSARNNLVYSIMKSFGISGRVLVESELNYVNKWSGSYGMALDLICEACKRTIMQTNKPSFPYADSILTSWHKAGVRTMGDVERLDLEHSMANVANISTAARTRNNSANTNTAAKPRTNTKFHNFSQRDYNFDELEKRILGN
ncbi:DnaD domain protein [Pseudobutyrivibrio xylanivorans]|uniref:DnaD and phage-associated domain-containing protein n=1 Tax=Pseudobutyrivibrio xylanivorans DSM 14809 TaxID=1123012 RepID=A0A1M6D5R7_PSEXY|nr:DnaD domain protein [Pseudobutyrivibrio xylanivorans]SHI68378.1 DnaD and phage-associated domain-containing protein [Pseudobutyrivibrio xylanivorans DSM 14809]